MNGSADVYDRTIRALCPEIQNTSARTAVVSEYQLRRELIACMLGSQVRFEMAVASLNNLESLGLLRDELWIGEPVADFQDLVMRALMGECRDAPGQRAHRFYALRASQIASLQRSLWFYPLVPRVFAPLSSCELRRQLIRDIDGIGPKQASMFLRNVGVCNDLAILDVHVVHFMIRCGLAWRGSSVSSLSRYEAAEEILKAYADRIGYSLGCVDVAIWVTMRAAKEISP
jgi:N-glycosylase/DNA lyase